MGAAFFAQPSNDIEVVLSPVLPRQQQNFAGAAKSGTGCCHAFPEVHDASNDFPAVISKCPFDLPTERAQGGRFLTSHTPGCGTRLASQMIRIRRNRYKTSARAMISTVVKLWRH